MIVNAEGQILGRLAAFAAKQALLGNEIIVVNAEKAIVSGKKDSIFREEMEKLDIRNLGNPKKGPFHQKRPDRFVRRTIRGMLPWEKPRGREAFRRVQVYMGVPKDEIKKRHGMEIEKSRIQDLEGKKAVENYTTVADICRFIGGKW
jgi:large subunit ribosomal protein L13